MKTLKMDITKREAAEEIVNALIAYHNSNSMPITIGLMDNGEVGTRHNVHGCGGMAVMVLDTEGADWGSDAAEWDEGDIEAAVACMADMWIDEAIERQNDSDDWNDEYTKVIWSDED